MQARAVAIGNVWTEGDGAVGVCVDQAGTIARPSDDGVAVGVH